MDGTSSAILLSFKSYKSRRVTWTVLSGELIAKHMRCDPNWTRYFFKL